MTPTEINWLVSPLLEIRDAIRGVEKAINDCQVQLMEIRTVLDNIRAEADERVRDFKY